MTLRIRIENGTLNCEFTEMEKPNKNEFIDNIWCKSGECPAYFKWVREFESSFQPITLSEEAREYLGLIRKKINPIVESIELSGKECECFEIVKVYHLPLWHYELKLKSVPVAENVVAGDGMKSKEEILENEMGSVNYSGWVERTTPEFRQVVFDAFETYASQYNHNHSEVDCNGANKLRLWLNSNINEISNDSYKELWKLSQEISLEFKSKLPTPPNKLTKIK